MVSFGWKETILVDPNPFFSYYTVSEPWNFPFQILPNHFALQFFWFDKSSQNPSIIHPGLFLNSSHHSLCFKISHMHTPTPVTNFIHNSSQPGDLCSSTRDPSCWWGWCSISTWNLIRIIYSQAPSAVRSMFSPSLSARGSFNREWLGFDATRLDRNASFLFLKAPRMFH